MKQGLSFLLLIGCLVFSCSQKPAEHWLVEFERSRVIPAADGYLNEAPVTVTAALAGRSTGGLHDYYSEGDYWWPDPENPDGRYIRRDGMTNPDNFTAHRKAMRRLSIQLPALVAAYRITGDDKYAQHAIRHLKAWFVDEATRMNPNLLYAQAIKGRVTGRGIGIIDTIHLVEVAQAIRVLEKNGAIAPQTLAAVKNWFSEYLEWMTTHPFGEKERDNGNNHSTCWAMQVAAFARLTGDEAKLEYCRQFYKETLLQQMAADGSFPKELKRTKPYGYSLFNLDAMAMVCELLSTPQDDLWTFTLPDGRGMQQAMNFMVPFIQDKSRWPYPPDVMYFDQWPVRQPALFFAGRAFHNSDYIELWKQLDADPQTEEIIRNYPIRQPLLWVE